MELRIIPTAQTEDAWTSASKAKLWLDSITDPHARTALARLIKHRKGEIFWCSSPDRGLRRVVERLGRWSFLERFEQLIVWHHDSRRKLNGNTSPPKPQEPELSMYEKFLISIGLAEAPPAPVNLGNPDVKVWVDLQTGLYYCPNADLYGHTPKGKPTTPAGRPIRPV